MFAVAEAGYCPVKLGMMSSRLQSGVNTLQSFREDKRNRITPGSHYIPLCRIRAALPPASACTWWRAALVLMRSPQCPTWAMGPSPPTPPPTTPALPTSARRILTLSLLSTEMSPVCRALRGNSQHLWHLHKTSLQEFLADLFPDVSFPPALASVWSWSQTMKSHPFISSVSH